jgi:hypothetical protein
MASVRVLHLVKAKFDYSGNEVEGQLSFLKNDVFPIISKEASGWWEGLIGGCVGWLPSTYVETLQSTGVAQVIEQAPKTLRMNVDQAKMMMATMVQQEKQVAEKKEQQQQQHQQQQQSKKEKKKIMKRPAFFKKKKVGIVSPPAERKPIESPRGEGKKKWRGAELQISEPVTFVHKTHLTGEQVSSSEALLEGAKQMGLTQTTAKKIIYGQSDAKPEVKQQGQKQEGQQQQQLQKQQKQESQQQQVQQQQKKEEQKEEQQKQQQHQAMETKKEESAVEEARPRVYVKELPPEPEEDEDDEEPQNKREEESEDLGRLVMLAASVELPVEEEQQEEEEGEEEEPGEEEGEERDHLARLLERADAAAELLQALDLLEGLDIGELPMPETQQQHKYPSRAPPAPPA